MEGFVFQTSLSSVGGAPWGPSVLMGEGKGGLKKNGLRGATDAPHPLLHYGKPWLAVKEKGESLRRNSMRKLITRIKLVAVCLLKQLIIFATTLHQSCFTPLFTVILYINPQDIHTLLVNMRLYQVSSFTRCMITMKEKAYWQSKS